MIAKKLISILLITTSAHPFPIFLVERKISITAISAAAATEEEYMNIEAIAEKYGK